VLFHHVVQLFNVNYPLTVINEPYWITQSILGSRILVELVHAKREMHTRCLVFIGNVPRFFNEYGMGGEDI
jgi:hypothetical protein